MGQFAEPITIYKALKHVGDNHYILPAFQRDFKWEDTDIELLFDSIMQGLPFNSMLFWKIDSKILCQGKYYEFSKNFIENPKRVAHNPYKQTECQQIPKMDEVFAVLDGQQRLTALRIGIYGFYEEHTHYWDYLNGGFKKKRLYLNLSKYGKEDIKYIFKFLKDEDTKEQIFYEDFNKNEKELWYKVGDVENYYIENTKTHCEIGDYYEEQNLSKEQKGIISLLTDQIFKERTINYYKEDTPNIDTAVKIFTRINNGGKTLSTAEIIYSIIKSCWANIDAREEIEKTIECVKNINFNIDIDYIIKAFLFLYSPSVKNEIRTFNNEFCKKLEDNWASIKDAIISVFETLKVFGMNATNLSANNATLPLLYFIYHKNIYKNFSTTANKDIVAIRVESKKWIYSVLLRQIFGSQGDNVLSQARNAFNPNFKEKNNYVYIDDKYTFSMSAINSSIEKITQQNVDEIIENLLNTQKDNPMAFLILSLLYPNIDYRLGDYHKDHMHNFSRYDELPNKIKEKYSKEMYNSIVNLQILDKNENESKNDMLLKQWVDERCKGKGDAYIKNFKEIHIIPDNIDLSLDNFDKFYEERKKLISAKLKQLI